MAAALTSTPSLGINKDEHDNPQRRKIFLKLVTKFTTRDMAAGSSRRQSDLSWPWNPPVSGSESA